MAEGLFRKMVESRPGEFEVSSAGISASDGYGPTDETVNVMSDEGVDISDHQSRRLTAAMVQAADAIFVMDRMHRDFILRLSPQAAKKVKLLTEFSPREHERVELVGIPDPIHMSPQFYKNVLQMIRECLEGVVKGGSL